MPYTICGKVKRKSAFDHQQIWRHNGLMGQSKRAILAMQAIYDADTTTDECRDLAARIERDLMVLDRLLRTRRDHINPSNHKR